MKITRKAALFAAGGGAYVGLEILYRGKSHVSMFAAGGFCFLLLGKLGQGRGATLARAAAGAGIITAVELATGLLVNRDYRVWDYRDQPGNFRGQICPAFTALWIPVAGLAMELYPLAEEGMTRIFRKNYRNLNCNREDLTPFLPGRRYNRRG